MTKPSLNELRLSRPAPFKMPPEEIERRRVARAERLKAAKWIFALAWCGCGVSEIAHVLDIKDLSLVRQPLYEWGWLHYEHIRRPAVLSDEIRGLWKDETNMPPGLKEALALQQR